MSDYQPDPDLLAAALRGAERGMRLLRAIEEACAAREVYVKPGDVAVIAEAAYDALTRDPDPPAN